MNKELVEYRKLIIEADQKTQEAYDKTVISLSGGALGISFAFIENFISPESVNSINILFFAWLIWGLSICAMLGSYFTSHLALRKTLNQINKNELYCSHVGGISDYITFTLNVCGGLLFVVGVILLSIFVKLNIGG